MSSDISRQRFDSKDNFSAVLMQQGRVLLDADWNEWMEIIDRRWRAETVDLAGRVVLPRDPASQGFAIAWAEGMKSLRIGRGRIYVAGLLAENHGAPPFGSIDPVLAELYSKEPLLLEQQYPAGKRKEKRVGIQSRSLVYLDVWQRELTAVERPQLIEAAVGVDSTARLQTAWQVRVLPNVGNEFKCGDPLDRWTEIVTPSAGRLSTDTVVPADNPDPCVISPSGGYRGLENRLYRIEIHEAGGVAGEVSAAGATAGVAEIGAARRLRPLAVKAVPHLATFKWARHNASIATRVVAVQARTLTVELTMRDGEMRFSIGDWVEIIDDEREFARRPGELRRITDVDDAALTLTLHAALPADELHPDVSHNLRVRKWDQKDKVMNGAGQEVFDLNSAHSTGAIPIRHDGDSFLLEDGIRVTFHLAPGQKIRKFHVADHWVFAARTEDAAIEVLNTAPPRGVHHHYCRLAIATPGKDIIDCRPKWPETPAVGGGDCCCCTACVSAEQHNSGDFTIQDGIDQVSRTGGTVCLSPGMFFLPSPGRGDKPGTLKVTGISAVKIKGHGASTVIAWAGIEPALQVADALGFTLEDVAFFTLSTGAGADVALHNCAGVGIERCFFIQAAGEKAKKPAVKKSRSFTSLSGYAAGNEEAGAASSEAIVGRVAVALSGFAVLTRIRDNVFLADVGIGNQPAVLGKTERRLLPSASLLSAGLTCDDNTLCCRTEGVSFGADSVHLGETRFEGNQIMQTAVAGIRTTGLMLVSELFAAANLDITDNTLFVQGDGIVFGTSDTRITGNDISSFLTKESGSGIVVVPGSLPTRPVSGIKITANRIRGMAAHGILVGTHVTDAFLAQNTLDTLGGGGVLMLGEIAAAKRLNVEQNRLGTLWLRGLLKPGSNDALKLGAQAFASSAYVGGAAIEIVSTQSVVVTGNVIDSSAQAAALLGPLAGIRVTDSVAVRVAVNQVMGLGTSDGDDPIAAIVVTGAFTHLDVVDNLVRHGSKPGVVSMRPWRALLIHQPPHKPPSVDKGGKANLSSVEIRRLLEEFKSESSTAVRGNSFECAGVGPYVRVVTAGDCVFGDNRIQGKVGHFVPVEVATRTVIFNTNYVTSPTFTNAPAVILQPAIQQLTVLGNMTTGELRMHSGPLPSPWDVLNARA